MGIYTCVTEIWDASASGIIVPSALAMIYRAAQDAATMAFRPNAERLDVVDTNQRAGSCNATPANTAGKIYIRTDRPVYCIGQ